MARAEGTPVAGIRDPVAFVAASLVPAAVLGLPVVRAVVKPGTLVLVFIFALRRLRRTMGLLLALLFLNLLRILRTLGILLSLFLLLLGPSRLLLLLLTPGPLPFFWTGGTGRLRATTVGGLLRTPRLLMAGRFWLWWLPFWFRLRWLLPSGSRRWLRPHWPRLGWLLPPGSRRGWLSLRIRRWLLPSRLGFLFLIGTPRLLFALIVLGVGRGHGLKQQGQDSHVDKSKRFHCAYLPHDNLVHPAPGARGTITCWIHPVSVFHASL
jgi:hypothetical protein